MAIDFESPTAAALHAEGSFAERAFEAQNGSRRPRPNAAESPPRASDLARTIAVFAALARRGHRLAEGESPSRFAEELATLRPSNVVALTVTDLLDLAGKAIFGPGPAGLTKGLTSGLLEDLTRRVRDLVRIGAVFAPEVSKDDGSLRALDALRFLIALIANARSLGEGFAHHLLPGFDGPGGLPGFQAADYAALGRGPSGRPLPTRELKCALLARLRAIDVQCDVLRSALAAPTIAALDAKAIENELAEFGTLKARLGEVLVQAMRSEQASNDAILRRLEL